MHFLSSLIQDLWPFALSCAIALCIFFGVDRFMKWQALSQKVQNNFARQILLLVLTAFSLVAVILTLPINDGMKSQLFSLVGLALTVVVALSSTTLVSNAMAGIMSRAIGSFKVGDFVRSELHFGRVTERGLFHTEIQTEDRDLTTLPNLYLVTHPICVVRDSGTIISSTVSIGYDIDHSSIKPQLIEAAKKTNLEDPFVRIMELGDFSVSYRVAGFLKEVTKIVSTRSRLNKAVLDALHAAGIEIASPTIMAQRPIQDGHQFIPTTSSIAKTISKEQGAAAALDERIFDKAERAAEKARLTAEKDQLVNELQSLTAELKDKKAKTDDSEKSRVISYRERRIEAIDRKIELMEKSSEK